MIEPLGFQITDKMLKRSGLDYWPRLDVTSYADIYDFYIRNGFKEDYDPAIVSSVSAYVDEDIKLEISANEIGDGIENAKKGDTESKVANLHASCILCYNQGKISLHRCGIP